MRMLKGLDVRGVGVSVLWLGSHRRVGRLLRGHIRC